LVVLSELLDHIGSRAGVWFATHEQVASLCAQELRQSLA
jgi:hypothetical protein